jgi:hypothetical protein
MTSTARKPDTGHPLGLWRCLVHDDGHVCGLAGSADLAPRIEAMHRLLTEFGLSCYRLDWLAPEDAVERYVYGLACKTCQVRLSCGCDIVTDVLAGNCPHGTAQAVQAAARRSGYLETGEDR